MYESEKKVPRQDRKANKDVMTCVCRSVFSLNDCKSIFVDQKS